MEKKVKIIYKQTIYNFKMEHINTKAIELLINWYDYKELVRNNYKNSILFYQEYLQNIQGLHFDFYDTFDTNKKSIAMDITNQFIYITELYSFEIIF
jgi:hypothetical protein